MTSEVYPYEDIIGGMPLSLKYGPSFQEFTKALAQQLDSFITGTERVQADLSPVNAVGSVLDSIGALLDVTRRAGQSDSTLSNIILNEVTTREQTTTDSLIAVIHDIIGVDPIISEYPDVDFINDHGLSKNEGAFLLTITLPDQERLKDVLLQTDAYKAAGIAAIYNVLSELEFTESFTNLVTLEELLLIFTYYYSEELLVLSDNLDGFEIGLTEALTSITDTLICEGVLSFIDELTTLDDTLSLEGDLYFSEDLTILNDYLGGGAIEAFHTESLTTLTDVLLREVELYFSDDLLTFDDVLSHEGVLYFTEDLTILTDVLGGGSIEAFFTEALTAFSEQLDMEAAFIDALTTLDDGDVSFEGALSFSEDLTTITDVLGGGAIDAIQFTESLPNHPIAIIGEAQLDIHIIGGHWILTQGDVWDVALWDAAEWDNSEPVLSIKELF